MYPTYRKQGKTRVRNIDELKVVYSDNKRYVLIGEFRNFDFTWSIVVVNM